MISIDQVNLLSINIAMDPYFKNSDGLIVTYKSNNPDLLNIRTSNISGIKFSVEDVSSERQTVVLATDEPYLDTVNAWDIAHAAKAADQNIDFVEPDLTVKLQSSGAKNDTIQPLSFKANTRCLPSSDYNDFWPHPSIPIAWHLKDEFSQLATARSTYVKTNKVNIAHLDTGYTPGHKLLPKNIIHDYEANFASDGGRPGSAIDSCNNNLGNQAAHGTGTICILAGAEININNQKIVLGGAPDASILPIRISPSVILLKTSALVKALDYILQLYTDKETPLKIDVISMSMGGLASKEWARAVNQIYERGIFMVTAAGNNLGGKTPTHIVYPARFNRVVAACGVTYDYDQYYRSSIGFQMMGNYGPDRLMGTALAAYTPNIPWAKGCCDNKSLFDIDGAGTSSATPQIAAAAALYINKYKKTLDKLEGWQKVEAVRHALFTSADVITTVAQSDSFKYFGNGILKAKDALNIAPRVSLLQQTTADSVRFPLFQVLLRRIDYGVLEMYELEILQLLSQSYNLQQILGNYESFLDLGTDAKKDFIDELLANDNASMSLRNFLKDNYTELTSQ